LREFDTKIFTFRLPQCALLLTGEICDRDVIVVYFSGLGNHEFWKISSYINCRDFAVIFAIFTKVYRVFLNHFFAVIFYCPYLYAFTFTFWFCIGRLGKTTDRKTSESELRSGLLACSSAIFV